MENNNEETKDLEEIKKECMDNINEYMERISKELAKYLKEIGI